MHLNRGLLFWGLALITAGATALAVQQNIVDRDLVADAWRLWPVILIAIGLSIVLARTPYAVLGTILAALVLGVGVGALVSVGPSVACTGNVPSDLTTESGDFGGDTASVNLDFNCGELNVAMNDGNGWTAGTAGTGDREVIVEAGGDSLDISATNEEGFNWDGGKQRWDVGLGSELAYDLRVSANAADATLDLAGGTFDRLEIDPNAASLSIDLSGATAGDFDMAMNAGSAEIQTDADTALAGRFTMNAGSFELCVADEAALRITVADGNFTFSHNLDDSGLTQSGDTWFSDTFDGAATFIDLRLEGNAASFTLNPDGGCS
jgi:hypothetical protein